MSMLHVGDCVARMSSGHCPPIPNPCGAASTHADASDSTPDSTSDEAHDHGSLGFFTPFCQHKAMINNHVV